MSAIGFSHVALSVNDWTRSRSFYTKLMEQMDARVFMDVQGTPHQDPRGHVLVFVGKGFMFSIWEAGEELRQNTFQFYAAGLHHLAFAADSRESVDELARLIPSIGGTIVDDPAEYDYVPGFYAVFFTDPDGVRLEFTHIPG